MSPLRTYVEHVFKTVETMDVNATVTLFAEDGVLFDPHYPSPQMVGVILTLTRLQRKLTGKG